MAKNSTISLVGALAGNLAVAVVKFVASGIGGSSAMLT
jgi:divalent metal cation (Fe/Co/Zn/Cd) transporter